MLNADDLKTYEGWQVASLADVDYIAVENEGFRRMDEAAKLRARAEKILAQAEKMQHEAVKIIEAARRERAAA